MIMVFKKKSQYLKLALIDDCYKLLTCNVGMQICRLSFNATQFIVTFCTFSVTDASSLWTWTFCRDKELKLRIDLNEFQTDNIQIQ